MLAVLWQVVEFLLYAWYVIAASGVLVYTLLRHWQRLMCRRTTEVRYDVNKAVSFRVKRLYNSRC